MRKILEKLKGGDFRSIGRSDEVVSEILKNPELFAEVFEGMSSSDEIMRMRSADAVEKVSRKHPEFLKPYKKRLIEDISQIEQQEVRWHVAQMFSRLEPDEVERKNIIHMLFSWIENSKSKIIIVNSMQTLADFAEKDSNIRPVIINKIEDLTRSGSAAVASRGKRLIRNLRRINIADKK